MSAVMVMPQTHPEMLILESHALMLFGTAADVP